MLAKAGELARRSTAHDIDAVAGQVLGQLRAERAAQDNPADVLRDLTAAEARAAALKERSARWQQTLNDGVAGLQKVLTTQFTERRDLLKARSALLALERVTRGGDRGLARDIERILAGAHEFAEPRLLSALRAGTVALPKPQVREAKRPLGDDGSAAGARPGLPVGADHLATRAAALEALSRWHGHAENPAFGRRACDACRVLVRTCEGLVTRSPGRH